MFNYITQNKKLFYLTLLTAPIAVGFDIGLAWLLRIITDAGTNGEEQLLPRLILISVLYIIFASISDLLYRKSTVELTNNCIYNVRNDLFNSITDESLIKISKQNSGYYISMFLNDLEDLKMDYFKNMVSSYHEILNFVISLVLLVKIDIIMAITIIIFSVVQLAVPFIFEKLIEKRQEELMNIRNEYTSSLQEFVNNFNLIKFFKREIIFQKINQDKSIEYRNASNTKETLSKTIYVLSFASSLAMYLACMLVGIWLVFKDRITIGQVIESSQLMAYVTGPLLNFTEIMTSFKSAKPVQNKIMNFISEQKPVEVEDEFEFNNLKLNNISFKYPTSDKYVLKNLDFTFEKGKKYIIIGESGTGKTTILKLISRLYDYDKGEILIDGKDIKEISTESLFDKVSIVFQDVVLFNQSVMENIRLGKQNASDEDVKRAAKLANCTDFIEKMDKGFDTVIGENGAELSGGERQRLSIARAFLKDAPILILDEIAASLDVDNEKKIQESLNNLIKDKTVVIISHRMKSIENADKIVVLENGKVESEGKHEELLQKSKVYKNLIEKTKMAEEFIY